jgi:hypothetical protein
MKIRGNSRPEATARLARYSRGRFTIAVAALLFMVCGSAYAQKVGAKETAEPTTETKTTVSPEKETKIRKLLDLTGAKQNAVDFGQQLGDYLKSMLQKSLPAGEHNEEIGTTLVTKLTERLNSDELIVRLIPVYDKAFTQDDLTGIISFYETSYGRKLLDATPTVMEEANNISEQWIKEMIPQILGQMVEKYPELKQPDAAPDEHSQHH